MLGTAALRQRHDCGERLQRINFTERREHFPLFKGNETVAFPRQRFIGRNNRRFCLIGQAVGLEYHRHPAVFRDVFNLFPVGIGVPAGARIIGHKSPCRKSPEAQLPSVFQNFKARFIVDEIHVAGIHVHCGYQPGLSGPHYMRGKTCPVHFTPLVKRQ